MYCKNCGKEIKPEDFKCPHCGTETRRATASKKLKKISMITIGCILAVILIGVIVYKSGIIQNWQKQKEEISYAEKMLKKFEFNTLGIEANEAWAALYFSGEDVYMPSCRINNELRMGYVQKGQYYEMCIRDRYGVEKETYKDWVAKRRAYLGKGYIRDEF